MDVQFWYTEQSKLADLEIQNGRIIALSDACGYYYDMGGKRHRACNLEYVDTLPSVNVMRSIQGAQAVDAGADREAVLDLLYITPDGIFSWNKDYDGTTATQPWNCLVPIDVKEADDDNYGYVRQNGAWTKLRWLICSRETMNASTLSEMIRGITSNLPTASIKISGTLNMNNNLIVSVEDGHTIVVDLTDCNITGENNLHLDATSGTIQVTGGLYVPCYISGHGNIMFNYCDISRQVTGHQFFGHLTMIGCSGSRDTDDALLQCDGVSEQKSSFIIQGCHFHNGTIALPEEDSCYLMISGNILRNTAVRLGTTYVDALYNNTGFVTTPES